MPISNLHLKERTGIRKELAAGKEAFDADAAADLLANIDEALQAARTRLDWIEQQGAERNSHMASECDNDSAID